MQLLGGNLRKTWPSNAWNPKRKCCDSTLPIQVHVTTPKSRGREQARRVAEQRGGENNPMPLLQPLWKIECAAKKKNKTLVKSLLLKRVAERQFKEEFSPLGRAEATGIQQWVLGYLIPGQTCTFEKSNDPEHFQPGCRDCRRELSQGMEM